MQRIALLESGKHVESAAGGSAASIALHVVILAFAIAVTSHAGGGIKRNDAVYIPLPPWRPDVRMVLQPGPKVPATTAAHVPAISVTVPTVIPAIIPSPASLPVVPEVIGTPSNAVPGAQPGTDAPGAVGSSDSPFAVEEVDVAAAAVSGQRGPAYPENLRMAGVEGRVVARFIIGKNGRVESDPTIVSATDEQFAFAVKRYLATARYRPATKNGEPVRQLAEQEFDFTVRR
jgi:periplasmic protein TonB